MAKNFTYNINSKGRFRCASNRIDCVAIDTLTSDPMTMQLSVTNGIGPHVLYASFDVIRNNVGLYYKDFSKVIQRRLSYDFFVGVDAMDALNSFLSCSISIDGDGFVTQVQNSSLNLFDWKNSVWSDYVINNGTTFRNFFVKNYRNKIELNRDFTLHFYTEEKPLLRGIKITTYNASGAVENTGTILYTINPSLSYGIGRVYCNIGTKNLQTVFGASFLDNAVRYTCEVEWLDLTTSGIPVEFTIVDYCQRPNIRLHWLNEYGGFDAFDFPLKRKHTQNIEKNSYKTRGISITQTDVEDNVLNEITNYIKKSYAVTINSDWCNDFESQSIQDLFASRVVFAEVMGNYYGVTIKDTSSTLKTVDNDELYQYELTIQLQGTTTSTL
jgi:hypothetical protein